MSKIQDKIIEYLKNEYDPEAIILAGSRVTGHELKDSDWDLWLLNSAKKSKAGFLKFEDEFLDVTIKDWPEEDKFFSIPYGPLYPSKVLFAKSEERAKELIKRTKEAYNQGPLDLYKDSVMSRFSKLTRWLGKIKQNVDNPLVEFFYAGYFYEVCLRAWFEVQNKWPVSPKQGLEKIKDDDPDFYDLLESFHKSSSKNRLQIAMDILEKLKKFI